MLQAEPLPLPDPEREAALEDAIGLPESPPEEEGEEEMLPVVLELADWHTLEEAETEAVLL